MEEQLISFETAKLAKEKGFDFKVLKQYSPDYEGVIDTDHSANCVIGGECALKYPDKDCVGAPTQSLLQRWLREEYNLHLYIKPMTFVGFVCYYDIYILEQKNAWDEPQKITGKTYEEALEIGLQEALKLIK